MFILKYWICDKWSLFTEWICIILMREWRFLKNCLFWNIQLASCGCFSQTVTQISLKLSRKEKVLFLHTDYFKLKNNRAVICGVSIVRWEQHQTYSISWRKKEVDSICICTYVLNLFLSFYSHLIIWQYLSTKFFPS